MSIDQSTVQDGIEHFCAWLDEAAYSTYPFSYWLLENILPPAKIDALEALPFHSPVNVNFEGRRESNNASRSYFTPANQAEFPICREVANIFASPRVKARLEACTGANLAGGRLRIEYCQDTDGFWLEPHCDIKEKLITLLIYLSGDPKLYDAGTDIYTGPPGHIRIASAPYARNLGLMFIPDANTWHGFSRRPINGVRKSLIINYVTPGFQAMDELS